MVSSTRVACNVILRPLVLSDDYVSEPKLFQVQDRHPQFPQKCMLPAPDALQTRRRLAGDAITEEAAEAACSNWETKDAKARCIYDVIATGDLTMAVAGSY